MRYVVEIKCGQVFLKATKSNDMLNKNYQKSWKRKLFLMKHHNEDFQEHSILKFGQSVYIIKKINWTSRGIYRGEKYDFIINFHIFLYLFSNA